MKLRKTATESCYQVGFTDWHVFKDLETGWWYTGKLDRPGSMTVYNRHYRKRDAALEVKRLMGLPEYRRYEATVYRMGYAPPVVDICKRRIVWE